MLLQERRKNRIRRQVGIVPQKRGIGPEDSADGRRQLLDEFFERLPRFSGVLALVDEDLSRLLSCVWLLDRGSLPARRLNRARLGSGQGRDQHRKREGREGGTHQNSVGNHGRAGSSPFYYAVGREGLTEGGSEGSGGSRRFRGSRFTVRDQSNRGVSSLAMRRRPSRRKSSRPPSQIRTITFESHVRARDDERALVNAHACRPTRRSRCRRRSGRARWRPPAARAT